MSKQMYTPPEKKNPNIVKIKIDYNHIQSNEHKYGALKHKSAVFEDRRFKKPKHKKPYTDDSV